MHKNLKFISLFFSFIVATFLIVSCSRDDNNEDSQNYIKVKIDGVERNFYPARATWVGNSLQMIASTTINNENYQLTISLNNSNNKPPVDIYNLDDLTGYTIFVHLKNYMATRGTPTPNDAFTLEISSLSNERVTGKIKGVLTPTDAASTAPNLILTDGSFSMKFSD